MANNKHQKLFTQKLLDWNTTDNKREMPWKGEKDPYKIWLSEIILQQTRVDQGLVYYKNFVKNFPTVECLAKAPQNKVFKLWEGLGYYTRCKNLIATANYIATDLQGKFPVNYEDILALKGIGPYTAAAISSFAFNLPYAVVDGNVFRVLARYFNIDTPIDSTEGKKLFFGLANDLLDKNQAGIYNQALMDFGATICKPQLPLCTICVLNKNCEAYKKGLVNNLPVKEKSVTKKIRWFYYFILKYNNKIFLTKRGSNDIWENLYEFLLIENEKGLSLKEIKIWIKKYVPEGSKVTGISQPYKQLLTHQTIYGQFIEIDLSKDIVIKGFNAVSPTAMKKLPFPKFITLYLKDKNVSLNL